jgi:putative heme-binding domain-containing protein
VSGGPDAGRLGPDLAGTWRNGLDYFLENIVDPNAVVGAAYELHILTRRDGTVVSGMIDRESDTAVVVRTVAETVTIPRADIRERQRTTQSLMPPGLLEALPEREAVELLKYLTEPR